MNCSEMSATQEESTNQNRSSAPRDQKLENGGTQPPTPRELDGEQGAVDSSKTWIDDPQTSAVRTSANMYHSGEQENYVDDTRVQMNTLLNGNSGQIQEGGHPQGTSSGYKALQWLTHKVPIYWILISSVFFALIAVNVGTAIYFQSTSKSEPLCPADWILVNRSCYYLSDSKKNFTDSQMLCNNYGGSLVMIRNNTKEDLNKLNTHDDFWIGLRRDENEWKWVDGTDYTEEVEEYRNDTRLDCAFLNRKRMALDCATSRRFICSKTASGVNT
ncbi:C-type lectin domain family 2 member D-like [Rana temporaria]|uniref:C-type lectin domain family 2 member D-like n=1 Tax=Rana temporaria TaxID=8407 RepID=UPI001AACDDDA|nr:C-type lectin domain family 2 member D-like [Rana temporaria]